MSTEFTLPELGENVTAGDVVRVLVSPGDLVAKEQPLLELETDKATIEVPSTIAGRIKTVQVKAGDKVKVGQVIFAIEETDGAGPEPKAASPAAVSKVVDLHRPAHARAAPGPEPPSGMGTLVPAAPSVRRLARELGVDIGRVSGSGPGGRIGSDDVKDYAKAVVSASKGAAAPVAPLPDFSKWGKVERRAMSGIRRKTAEHLSQAWTTIPHVSQHDVADITAVEAIRQRYAVRAEQAGGKLTITAIALKAVAAALQKFPQFNTAIDMAAEEIIYKQYVHVGVAVDTDRGLLVPVIRNVDQKGIIALSVELAQASERARSRKLTLEDMEGGSFTITNLGGIGGTSFDPIVNYPEVAILGLSRARMEPVWQEGQFVPRLVMPLSLSYDHRVIDGADAARFLRFLAEAFEQPIVLAL